MNGREIGRKVKYPSILKWSIGSQKNEASAIKEGSVAERRRNKIKLNPGVVELFTRDGRGWKDCWNSVGEHEGAHGDGQSSNLGRRFSSRGRKEGVVVQRETIEASSWWPVVVDGEVSI